MRRKIIAAGVVVTFCLMAAILLLRERDPRERDRSYSDKRISFIREKDRSYDLYTIGTDGRGLRRLTENNNLVYYYDWSPDGTRIAFQDTALDGSHYSCIYVVNSDGSGKKMLAPEDKRSEEPAWSHDGDGIAFHSDREGNWEIYVMEADGANPRRLTRHPAPDRCPVWSPDGRRLAFVRMFGNYNPRTGAVMTAHSAVVVMDEDGENEQQLTKSEFLDQNPEWSPDGTRIVFTSNRDGNQEIYVMDADGKNQSRLTKNQIYDMDPVWSPDGTRIAFTAWDMSAKEQSVAIVGADGSNLSMLIRGNGSSPRWSPDGKRILFSTSYSGSGIYLIDADGDNQECLTKDGFRPFWKP